MMRNNLIKVFLFTAGAAVGSAVTWKLLKTKYEQIAQEEIESIREYYSDKYKTNKEESGDDDMDEEPDEEATEEDYEEYTRLTNEYAGSEKKQTSDVLHDIRPYIIDYEEFGEIPDYEEVVCYFYADGVLATEDGEPIGNIDDVIGLEALKHFGDFAENAVFVRNDRLRADYQILMSAQNYAGDDDDEDDYS